MIINRAVTNSFATRHPLALCGELSLQPGPEHTHDTRCGKARGYDPFRYSLRFVVVRQYFPIPWVKKRGRLSSSYHITKVLFISTIQRSYRQSFARISGFCG